MYIPSPDEFQEFITVFETDDVVRELIISGEPRHVSRAGVREIGREVATTFGVSDWHVDARIVGSARLGYSLIKKTTPEGALLPRYRPFGPGSDIDVAIISPKVFGAIWLELSAFSHQSTWWPWKARKLGDYLVCGWLRPDHFPVSPSLRLCPLWRQCFGRLSRSQTFGRRRVRGGLFFSEEHLLQYHRRAVRDCIQALEA